KFEHFVTHLLTLVGFEATATQYTGDRGVDVIGTLNPEGLANITLKAQVKRISGHISNQDILMLRGTLGVDEHGVLITTGGFTKQAQAEASLCKLRQRLSSYGMRPINNVVDVTNYVMLEYGQPLHAFDYHKLEGKQIIVRRVKNGETITTLDGIERVLSPDALVIADKEKAVAIAGIMGGSDTEVTDKTTSILLESANFNQAIIRQGCRCLNLQSEASIRFDKGLNPDLPLLPLKRATQLLLELAGGKAARGIVDVYPGKLEP
ncbi:unnamed protein product, partial [marine sediment metagenome]